MIKKYGGYYAEKIKMDIMHIKNTINVLEICISNNAKKKSIEDLMLALLLELSTHIFNMLHYCGS